MIIISKTFNELTLDELYALLKLRSQVFVVEQDCVYQDIDEKDKKSQACALEVSQEDSGAQIVDFRESYLEKQAESKENLEQSDPDNDDGTPTKESGPSKR